MYFLACDPRPPAKSKVRQLAEKLAESVKKLLAPIPKPVPIRIPSKYGILPLDYL